MQQSYHGYTIERRLRLTQMTLTALRGGVNVFTTSPGELSVSPSFFLTALSRTEKSNPWGSTRVAALARLNDVLYAIHYVCPEIGKVALTDELTAFNNQTAQFQGVRRAMIFAGDSYADILAELEADRPPLDAKLVYYGDAYRQIQWPIHIVSCDSTGAAQLKIMSTPDYRTRLTKAVLGSDYVEPPGDIPQWDGFYHGIPFVMAADMDLRRIDEALEVALTQGHSKIAMACLKGPQWSLLRARYDATGRAEVYKITFEALSSVLGADNGLYVPPPTQYLTKKGDVVHAPLIKTR